MMRIPVTCVYRRPPRIIRCNTSKLHISSKNLQAAGLEGSRRTGRFGKVIYFLGTVTLASGATVAYAKYDPEFHKWLSENVPYSNEVIELVVKETSSLYDALSHYIIELRNQIWDLVLGKEDKIIKPKLERKPVQDDAEKKDYKHPTNVVSSLVKVPPESKSANVEGRLLPENSSPANESDSVPNKGEKAKESDALPVPTTDSLIELEYSAENSVKAAIQSYKEAACACQEHGKDIQVIVEESVEKLDPKIWSEIKIKAETKENALDATKEKAKIAKKDIERLQLLLEKSPATLPEAQKESARQTILRLQEELSLAVKELELARKRADVTDRYWKKVEDARKHFAEELEILIPSIRITDKKLKMSKGDLDLFLLYAFRTVLYYQKELSKLETIAEQRLQNAIEASGGAVDKAIIIAEVEAELERERRKLDAEFQKKALGLKAEAERELRLQLKRQAEAHADHLRDALMILEAEVSRRFQRAAEERIAEQQAKYKLQVASMMGRLTGLETALKARADADKKAAQAQLLWSAAQSLYSSLKAGVPGAPWIEQLHPLEAEVVALRNAAVEGDELVEAVVTGIPQEAVSRGVYPEDALRERFLKVQRVAQRMALLPETGGSLPMYLLSYLQSIFLINAVEPIPQAELANEPVDLSHLDTFDILQRARYWLDRGNFNQTLKYMNLLKGASRKVASDWMNETRILLETQQAAGTLLAHAAAAGLIHL